MPRTLSTLAIYPLIAVFWLVMWVMLLRSEWQPQSGTLRTVPPEHIAKLLFQHQQISDLRIHGDGVVGHLRVTPRVRPGDARRVLELNGNLQMMTADGTRQQFAWDGALEMDETFTVKLLQFGVSTLEKGLHPTEANRIQLVVNPADHRASYNWTVGGRSQDQQDFTLDDAGLKQLLNHVGLDSSMLQNAPISRPSIPKIDARQSTMNIDGGNVETLLLTVVENGQTMVEVQIGPDGEILQAKTILGWMFDRD